MSLEGKRIGYALSGSHCTLENTFRPMARLREMGADVIPIVSYTVSSTATRFGTPEGWLEKVREISGHEPLKSIPEVEPIGPKNLVDTVLVAPCTGNTLARLANAINDSPVTMATKACLRNGKPVVLAITSNDLLGMNARNLGMLLAAKHVYFVPFGQDNPAAKPNSMESDFDLIPEAVEAALQGRQLQPLLVIRQR